MTATAPAIAPVLARVLSLQNADGGFGARGGLPSTTEPTALASLALSFENAAPASAQARDWLVGAQTSEGGWPATSSTSEPSWTTGLAVLALARPGGAHDEALRGARWLLGQEGRKVGAARSLIDRLLGRQPTTALDDSLVGWPWHADTFSWVEPTAYAVLALEAVRESLPQDVVARRMDLARRMIADRMCPDGGWNYGNSRVLGQGLWPYPDTTALGLLALHEHAESAITSKSLDALEHMLAENESGLATSLGILALSEYGREVRALRTRLRERFVDTGFLGETRVLAYALLALNEGARPFGGGTGA